MHKVLSSLNIPTGEGSSYFNVFNYFFKIQFLVSDNYSENVKSVDSVEITNLRRVMAVVIF